LVALTAGFIWAELAARRPNVGGQYAYLRDAFHPLIAFLYGWTLLLVIQTGGMAAVSFIFARYFRELSTLPIPEGAIAIAALTILTGINCLGVRAGSTVQNALMLLKILAIAALILSGLLLPGSTLHQPTRPLPPLSFDLLTAFGAAMVPVLFAYGGWQTATFVAGEIREPQKNLPRALIIGVAGVVVLYLLVNLVCILVLGPKHLAETTTPASDVMKSVLGDAGGRLIAAGIAISTLGFLSQGMLTAPRVYYAMARDELFFKRVGQVNRRTHVPVVAVAVQGLLAIGIVLVWGRYERILDYVVSIDFIFFGATALAVFVFRNREKSQIRFKVPFHPFTTGAFIAISWIVVVNTIYRYPENTLLGVGLLLAGIPIFYLWRRIS
jgi:APA family basic amino acid/polyamine antiporter